jgi:hypothetical protein
LSIPVLSLVYVGSDTLPGVGDVFKHDPVRLSHALAG